MDVNGSAGPPQPVPQALYVNNSALPTLNLPSSFIATSLGQNPPPSPVGLPTANGRSLIPNHSTPPLSSLSGLRGSATVQPGPPPALVPVSASASGRSHVASFPPPYSEAVTSNLPRRPSQSQQPQQSQQLSRAPPPAPQPSSVTNGADGMRVSLEAYQIRVGTRKFMPASNVVFKDDGVLFTLREYTHAPLLLNARAITKCKAHLNQVHPVLFFALEASCVKQIRSIFQMSEDEFNEKDPLEKKRCITVFPKSLTTDEANAINHSFTSMKAKFGRVEALVLPIDMDTAIDILYGSGERSPSQPTPLTCAPARQPMTNGVSTNSNRGHPYQRPQVQQQQQAQQHQQQLQQQQLQRQQQQLQQQQQQQHRIQNNMMTNQNSMMLQSMRPQPQMAPGVRLPMPNLGAPRMATSTPVTIPQDGASFAALQKTLLPNMIYPVIQPGDNRRVTHCLWNGHTFIPYADKGPDFGYLPMFMLPSEAVDVEMGGTDAEYQREYESDKGPTVEKQDHLADTEKENPVHAKDGQVSDARNCREVWGLGPFRAWLAESGFNPAFEEMQSEDLAKVLERFYPTARTKSGELYAKNSLRSIRRAIQIQLNNHSPDRQIDILSNPLFEESNRILSGFLTVDRFMSDHKILPSDVNTLYAYVFTDTPEGLQKRIFFEIGCHFGRATLNQLRRLRKDHFQIKVDTEGSYYVKMVSREFENSALVEREMCGRMYAQPWDPDCPVKYFQRYLLRLNTASEIFFQEPVLERRALDPWYRAKLLNCNVLTYIMMTMSIDGKLSKVYRNNCFLRSFQPKSNEAEHTESTTTLERPATETEPKSIPELVSSERSNVGFPEEKEETSVDISRSQLQQVLESTSIVHDKSEVPSDDLRLHCHNVRVGSIRSQSGEPVIIKNQNSRLSIHFKVKLGSEPCGFQVSEDELSHCFICFQKVTAMFLFPNSAFCQRVRYTLKMKQPPKDPSYDINSTEERQRHLVLFLRDVTPQMKDDLLKLKRLMGQSNKPFISELDAQGALKILRGIKTSTSPGKIADYVGDQYSELHALATEIATVDPTPVGADDDDDDVIMTSEELTIKCPYTQQVMKEPVRNKNCSHNYEKVAIHEFIARRRSKGTEKSAKCPYAGCGNQVPLTMEDLEDNAELKEYIRRKTASSASTTPSVAS